MRARISSVVEKAGPSFKLPRTHRPITLNNPQGPANGLEGETCAHLCLQFNSHLARDIGAQPDLQDLDKAPSAASAAGPPTC